MRSRRKVNGKGRYKGRTLILKIMPHDNGLHHKIMIYFPELEKELCFESFFEFEYDARKRYLELTFQKIMNALKE